MELKRTGGGRGNKRKIKKKQKANIEYNKKKHKSNIKKIKEINKIKYKNKNKRAL